MSLRVNFGYTLISRLIYAVSQWLLLVAIAQYGSPEQLGEFAFALAVASPIIVLSQLNMQAFMATDAKGQFQFKDYLYTQYLTSLIALLLITSIALLFLDKLESILVVVTVGLYKAIESVSSIYYGALQRQERMREVAISVICHGLSALAAVLGALLISDSVLYCTLIIVIFWLIILVGYDQKFTVVAMAPVEAAIFKIIYTCYPLGLTLAMLSLRINIPVYFLQAQLGSQMVGFYSAIAYFVVAGNMLTGSLLQAAAPRISNFYSNGDKIAYLRVTYKLLAVALATGMCGILTTWLFGGEILEIVYGKAYTPYLIVFLWIMAAAAMMYISQVFGLLLTVSRNFSAQVTANVIGIATTSLLCLWLIPVSSVTGAAQAFFGGTLATCLVNVIAVCTYHFSAHLTRDIYIHSSKKI